MNRHEQELQDEVDDLVRRSLDILPVPSFMMTKVRPYISTFVERVVVISCKYTRAVAQEEVHRAMDQHKVQGHKPM